MFRDLEIYGLGFRDLGFGVRGCDPRAYLDPKKPSFFRVHCVMSIHIIRSRW